MRAFITTVHGAVVPDECTCTIGDQEVPVPPRPDGDTTHARARIRAATRVLGYEPDFSTQHLVPGGITVEVEPVA